MADYDGDGLLDLISGSNCCDPYGLHLFRRRPDGSFAPRRHLEVEIPREDRETPTHQSRPSVTDWDGDGRPDLLFTTTKAACLYVGTRWPVGDEPMQMSHVELPGPTALVTGNIAVADWDGDGVTDVVLGRWYPEAFGRIDWFRNVGFPGAPQLEEGRMLVPGTAVSPFNSGFCVTDWDGDDRLDLILARCERRQDPAKPRGWDIRGQLWLYPGR